MKIKTGLVGCGKVGHFHAKAYASLEQSEFTAVCDFNAGRADAFAKEYGVKAFTSVSEMVEKTGVQALSVCTPHPIHAQAALQAINGGAHVMIEKPLASSLKDCDAIISAAQKNKVQIGITCQRRFYRPCMRIRDAIDSGKIGKPVLGQVTMLGWRDMAYYASDPWRGTWTGEGGGVLVNQAPHQLDLLLWYMGEIDELFGYWDTLNHPGLEVEDTAIAVIRFKNGGLGNILVSNSQNPALYGKVHIHGENGATVGVQTDGGAMFIAGMSSITEPPVNDLWTVPGEENMLETWVKEDSDYFNSVDSMHHYHKVTVDDFLTAVCSGRSPLITGIDGRRTVELFTAIYRSQRDRKPVKFPLKPENGSDFDGRIR